MLKFEEHVIKYTKFEEYTFLFMAVFVVEMLQNERITNYKCFGVCNLIDDS